MTCGFMVFLRLAGVMIDEGLWTKRFQAWFWWVWRTLLTVTNFFQTCKYWFCHENRTRNFKTVCIPRFSRLLMLSIIHAGGSRWQQHATLVFEAS
jgi:hypothetical protein